MKKKLLAASAAAALGSLALVGHGHTATAATSPSSPHVGVASPGSHAVDKATPAVRTLLAHSDAAGTLGAVTVANADGYQSSVQVTISTASSGGTGATLYSVTMAPATTTFPLDLPAGTYTITAGITFPTASTVTHTFTVTGGADVEEGLGAFTAPATMSFADFTDNLSKASGVALLGLKDASANAGAVSVKVDGTTVASNITDGGSVEIPVAGGTHTVAAYNAAGTALFSATGPFDADNYYSDYLFDAPTVPAGPQNAQGFAVNQNYFIQGYQFAASDGGVFSYGGHVFKGSLGGLKLNAPIVAGANFNPYTGYYLAGSDGGVFAFGANFHGSLGATKLAAPIVSMADNYGSDGNAGYLLLGGDGGVFAYNTPFYGSLAGKALTSPVVGIASDQGTGGYLIAQANGTVTAFTAAGVVTVPPPAAKLSAPIVGIAEIPQVHSFYLVAADGGVFAENGAGFYGSAGNIKLNQPIVGMVPAPDGLGYYLIAQDGGVFAYGNAPFYGSTGGIKLVKPVVAALHP